MNEIYFSELTYLQLFFCKQRNNYFFRPKLLVRQYSILIVEVPYYGKYSFRILDCNTAQVGLFWKITKSPAKIQLSLLSNDETMG